MASRSAVPVACVSRLSTTTRATSESRIIVATFFINFLKIAIQHPCFRGERAQFEFLDRIFYDRKSYGFLSETCRIRL